MEEKVKRITTTRAGSKRTRARAESAGDGNCLTATTTNKSCKPFCRLFKSFFRKKNDIFPKYEHVKSVFICFSKKTSICWNWCLIIYLRHVNSIKKTKFIHYYCYKFDHFCIVDHQEEFKYLINFCLIKMAFISARFIWENLSKIILQWRRA